MNISQNIQSSMVNCHKYTKHQEIAEETFQLKRVHKKVETKSNGYVRSRRESRGQGVETQHAGSGSSASKPQLATSNSSGASRATTEAQRSNSRLNQCYLCRFNNHIYSQIYSVCLRYLKYFSTEHIHLIRAGHKPYQMYFKCISIPRKCVNIFGKNAQRSF